MRNYLLIQGSPLSVFIRAANARVDRAGFSVFFSLFLFVNRKRVCVTTRVLDGARDTEERQ